MGNIMKDNYRLQILITFDISVVSKGDIEYVIDTIFELFTEDIDIQFGINSIKIQCDTDMDMTDYVEVLDVALGSMSSCQVVIRDIETNESFFKSYFNLETNTDEVPEDESIFDLREFGKSFLDSNHVSYDLDTILDKISDKGMESLTEGELNFLKSIKK